VAYLYIKPPTTTDYHGYFSINQSLFSKADKDCSTSMTRQTFYLPKISVAVELKILPPGPLQLQIFNRNFILACSERKINNSILK